MAKRVAKKHYIADEKLGGIEREYVEVDRKAVVGDFIHVTIYADELEDAIVKFDHVDSWGDLVSYENNFDMRGERFDLDDYDEYTTLSPTENVRISNETGDGVIYRMVDRIAQVGEKILHVFEGKSDGKVLTVTSVGLTCVDIEPYVDEERRGGLVTAIDHGYYRVLEPVSSDEDFRVKTSTKAGNLHVELTIESEVLTSLTDMLASLAVKVTEQQRELDVVKRQIRGNTSILSDRIDANTDDIQTFAEELTEFKAEQADFNEMLTGDIVSLDERTQSEELAHTISKELAKGAMIRGLR